MATPKAMVDGTTPLNAANLNKFLTVTKLDVKLIYAHILYNGATWEVDAGEDSAEIVTGDISLDAGTTKVFIVVAGFTALPIIVAMPSLVDTAYNVKGEANSATRVDVAFYAIADGARIATGVPDVKMDFNALIIGV